MTSTHAGYDDIHRGRHICLPFESDAEKLDAVASFLVEGLSQGKRCLFVGSPEELAQLGEPVEQAGICLTQARSRGRLVYMTSDEAYLTNGAFEPAAVLSRIESLIRGAMADGFTGLYATGALGHVPSEDVWRRIVSYEAQINESFARMPVTSLCRYPRAVVPPCRVQDVLRTHPVAIVRGQSCKNPFYERTHLALSDDCQARLDWQLRQLRVQNRLERHLQDQTYSAVNAAVELATELEALRAKLRDSGA
jgi:hypothetical protein